MTTAGYYREWRRRPHDIRPEQHGTHHAYSNLMCRCGACTAANRLRAAAATARLAGRPRDEVPHGTLGGYNNWSCRCPACMRAKQRRNAATGASRRQARGLPPTPWQALLLAEVAS